MLTVIFQKCFLSWQSWLSRASSLSWNLGRDVLSKLLPQEEKRNVKSWTIGFETPEAISSIIELKPARGEKPISSVWLVAAKCCTRPRKGVFNLNQQMLFKHFRGAKWYPPCCGDVRMTKKGSLPPSGWGSRGWGGLDGTRSAYTKEQSRHCLPPPGCSGIPVTISVPLHPLMCFCSHWAELVSLLPLLPQGTMYKFREQQVLGSLIPSSDCSVWE